MYLTYTTPNKSTKSAKSKPVIAVDFDGVLCISDKGKMSEPLSGSLEALEMFIEWGYDIVIFTLRAKNKRHVEDWLDFYGIPYKEVTDRKPQADFYIDDKAIRHINWADTLSQIQIITGNFQ